MARKQHPAIKSIRSTDHSTTKIENHPAVCYVIIEPGGIAARIDRGEMGYTPAPTVTTAAQVDAMNEAAGVSPAMRESMLLGSMFGWDKPGADPDRAEKIYHRAGPLAEVPA